MRYIFIIAALLVGCSSRIPAPITKAQFADIEKMCRTQGRVIIYGVNIRGQIVEAHCGETNAEYDQEPATVQDVK